MKEPPANKGTSVDYAPQVSLTYMPYIIIGIMQK